jgi:hypothetical protein
LADWKGVHEAALRPQVVRAAGQLHGRARAEVALKHLAVIADGFDDACGPSIVKAQVLTMATLEPEQAANHEVLTLLHFREISLSHSAFFRLNQCLDRPVDDSRPLRIFEAIRRHQRILGDHVRQNFKILGHALEGDAFVGELRDVGSDRGAVAGDECCFHFALPGRRRAAT